MIDIPDHLKRVDEDERHFRRALQESHPGRLIYAGWPKITNLGNDHVRIEIDFYLGPYNTFPDFDW